MLKLAPKINYDRFSRGLTPSSDSIYKHHTLFHLLNTPHLSVNHKPETPSMNPQSHPFHVPVPTNLASCSQSQPTSGRRNKIFYDLGLKQAARMP